MKRVALLILLSGLISFAVSSQDPVIVTTVKKERTVTEKAIPPVTEKQAVADTLTNPDYGNQAASDTTINHALNKPAEKTANDTTGTAANKPESPVKAVEKKYSVPIGSDILSIGMGFGLDYGGIGWNVMFYQQRNLGIFAGLGYNFKNLGYNVGTKARVFSRNPDSPLSGNALIMYGYNTVIYDSNTGSYDKVFYGLTMGLGTDIKLSSTGSSYMSLSLLFPLRGSDVKAYVDKKFNGEAKYSHILFSFGLRLVVK